MLNTLYKYARALPVLQQHYPHTFKLLENLDIELVFEQGSQVVYNLEWLLQKYYLFQSSINEQYINLPLLNIEELDTGENCLLIEAFADLKKITCYIYPDRYEILKINTEDGFILEDLRLYTKSKSLETELVKLFSWLFD